MAPVLQVLIFLVSLPWFLIVLATATSTKLQSPQQYIVYMGSSWNENGEDPEASESAHLQLLSSIIPSLESERITVIHHYNHAFKGFSAMLTQHEASVLSGHDGVVSVFKDPILQLHTTRSWSFLDSISGIRPTHGHQQHSSSDVIIGLIDTGIWPESPSFNDHGIGEIPSRWKGICMEGSDFKKSNCNRKLIGARYYSVKERTYNKNNKADDAAKSRGSPRDYVGHGTHTTSIAAGAAVANASYNGLATGTAKGGSPSARIAMYKACTSDGCSGSTVMKAIDDAVKDGVDVISISIGMNSVFQSNYLSDPIAIGAFHAEQRGVMIVCSGGNDGPDAYTIVNSAPWIFTVAASNIDRDFQSTVILGNGKTFQGTAINFSNLTYSRTYPLVRGEDVAASFTPISEARICYPGSLDEQKVAGRIVVCTDLDSSTSRQIKKLVAEDAGAKGLILIGEDRKGVPLDSGSFPLTQVGNIAGAQILRYINVTRKPTATIPAAVDVPRYKPAPSVAYFSSRGPGQLTQNILKPDIMAPGVAILAAMTPESNTASIPNPTMPSGYALESGTSMACPHVAGAAALIKSVHPGWSSSMIKSALMTTATIYDNMRKPLTNSSHSRANQHEMGAGEISPHKALDPGLVFETTTEDYLQFLCYYGYKEKIIRSMSNTNYSCPSISHVSLISNVVNYPTISISNLDRHGPAQTVKRSVTNVGSPNATYNARVHAPKGMAVSVFPKKMVFMEGSIRRSFGVTFSGKEAPSGYNFGSVTWLDGHHSVRVVFTVNVQ